MHVYHFTEQPYPDAWLPDAKSLRVTLPNDLCDPEVLSKLYSRYFDEWVLADELGLDIMVNEHHSTSTCVSPSANVTLGILARITKRARLLALGVPIANRPDPVRVAEELAMIDVISGGRLEMGLVKGVPYEIAPANSNPSRMMDRFWEAHDLILKAMTTQSGPFSWEGEYFHFRNVNIWPRPYQQPHPPVWISSLSPGSAPGIAQRGYVIGTVLNGMAAKPLFDAYRTSYVQAHGRSPGIDRMCYTAFGAVASNEEEGLRRGAQVAGYLQSGGVVATPFITPPGYMPPKAVAHIMKYGKPSYMAGGRNGETIDLMKTSTEGMIDAGVLFAGTPDQVFKQITRFGSDVGGFGHLILMMQAGNLNHHDTADSMTLFATEVLPRLQEWSRQRALEAA